MSLHPPPDLDLREEECPTFPSSLFCFLRECVILNMGVNSLPVPTSSSQNRVQICESRIRVSLRSPEQFLHGMVKSKSRRASALAVSSPLGLYQIPSGDLARPSIWQHLLKPLPASRSCIAAIFGKRNRV